MKKIYLLLLLFAGTFSVYSQTTWYWTNEGGIGDGNWGTSTNWDDGYGGSGLPAIGDNVVFDADATGCNDACNINVATFNSVTNRLGSLTIQGNYTATVSQNNTLYVHDVTITTGTLAQGAALYVGDDSNGDGSFTINGGTFTGASQAIYFNGDFTLSSGSYTSTSGTARVIRDFTYSAGTFNAGTGTSTFQFHTNSTTTTTQTITGSVTFNNLQIVTLGSVTADYTTIVVNTLTVNGTFTFSTGLGAQNRSLTCNTGTINIDGSFSLGGSSTSTNGGGSATFVFRGSGAQSISGASVEGRKKLPGIKINKTGGTLTLFNIVSVCGDWDFAAGTLDATTNSTTVCFCGTMPQTIKGAQNNTFYNLKKNSSQTLTIGDPTTSGTVIQATNTFTWTDNNDAITVGNGQNVTLTIPGDLTINTGCTLATTANGTINVPGHWTNDGTYTANTGSVNMTGADKNITGSSTSTFYNLTTNISGDGKIIIPSGKSATVSGTLTIGSTDTLIVDCSSSGVNGSLITSGTITNNGTCKLKSAITSGKWHCVSSAVTSINIETLFDNAASTGRKYYDETQSTDYWQPPAGSLTGAMTVGKGYYIYYASNKYERHTGTFNNANASPAISYGVRNWNLVGNPFPCAVNWNYIYNNSCANLDGSIQIKNGSGWTVISQADASPYVQPGQGFFVKANAGSPTITIGTASRVHFASGTFLKATQPYTKLALSVTSGSLGSNTRFFFLNDATNEFDHPYDADKLWDDNTSVPELFSLSSQNDTLALNALPLITQDLVIPLGLNATVPGTYTITADEIANFDTTLDIFLEDIETNILTNLKTTPGYTFTTASPVNKTTSRFNLRFSYAVSPVITQDISSIIKCEGESVAFVVNSTGSPVPSYQWYGPEGILSGETTATLSIPVIATVNAGDYYCIVSNSHGTAQSATAALTVNQVAVIGSQPVSASKCDGEATALSVTASGTNIVYQWRKDGQDILNETGSSLQFTNLSSADNAAYTCVVTNSCNSVVSDAAMITVNPYPVVDLGANQSVCEGTTVTLDAGNIGATYLWNDNSTGQQLTATATGSYTVAVTKDGCTSNAGVDITVNPYPVVDLGADQSVCEGTSVVLDAGNTGATYLWGDYSTNQQLSVNVTGVYSVAVTKDGCTTDATVNITVNPYPVVNLGPDQSVCEGASVIFDAGNAGATYLWNDSSTGQQFTATATGSYSVAVTKDGCTANADVNLIVNPYPVVALGADQSVCEGTPVTLDAGNAGATYLWGDNSTNQQLPVTVSGVYSVAVTKDGCTSGDEIQVTINAYPVVNLGSSQTACEGTTVALDAGNPGMIYLWSNGSTDQQLQVTSGDIYEVTVSNNGCLAQDYVLVNFKPTPVVALGQDINTCSGNIITLDAGYVTGNVYNWSNGSHNQIINPSTGGIYAVSVTNNGCTGADSISITINPAPPVNLGNDQLVCENTPVTLDAGTGSSYTWSTGETTQQVQVTGTGTYAVTVTDNGCDGTDQVSVTFKPAPFVALGQDVSACEGTPVLLDAGYVTGNTYAWSNGNHNQVINVSVSDTYEVTVTNNGCSSTDVIQVLINAIPVVDLGPNQSICETCTITLDAGNPGASYLWSTAETSQTIDITTAGVYSVTVTSDNCTETDEVIIDLSSGITGLANEIDISLFPNPASGIVNVSTGFTGGHNINVTDISGKTVMSINTDRNNTIIDTYGLEKGIYLFRVSNSEKVYYKTLVKD